MVAEQKRLIPVRVSEAAFTLVNGKKIHPRESFRESLDRVLQVVQK